MQIAHPNSPNKQSVSPRCTGQLLAFKKQNSMKTPSEVPGLFCSQGKPLTQSDQHGSQSIIWFINSSWPSPCCLIFPPYCLSLHLTPSLPWLPPVSALSCSLSICTRLVPIHLTLEWQWGRAYASSIFLKWEALLESSWRGERKWHSLECSTSHRLQLYTFWSRLQAPCQVPRWKAFGFCSTITGTRDSSIMAGAKHRQESARVAHVGKHCINC